MRRMLPLFVSLCVFTPTLGLAGSACCGGSKPSESAPTPPETASPGKKPAPTSAETYPLTGVIVDLVPAQQALLVKHEEIPGFMRPMTMLLKVDPAVLAAAHKGQSLVGQLSRREDGWWLTEVALKE